MWCASKGGHVHFSNILCDLGLRRGLWGSQYFGKTILGKRKSLGKFWERRVEFETQQGWGKVYVFRSMKQPHDMNVVSAITVFDEEDMWVSIEERMVVENLAAKLVNFKDDFWSNYVERVNVFQGMRAHSYDPRKLDLHPKNKPSPPTKLGIEVPLLLKLKQLPNNLSYVFLGTKNTLLLILAANLNY